MNAKAAKPRVSLAPVAAFVKVATSMGPTSDLDDRAGGIERVVPRIGIGL